MHVLLEKGECGHANEPIYRKVRQQLRALHSLLSLVGGSGIEIKSEGFQGKPFHLPQRYII